MAYRKTCRTCEPVKLCNMAPVFICCTPAVAIIHLFTGLYRFRRIINQRRQIIYRNVFVDKIYG